MPDLAPRHVYPIEPAEGRGHLASETCWCGPSKSFRDAATGALVFRHRTPPPPPKPREDHVRPASW